MNLRRLMCFCCDSRKMFASLLGGQHAAASSPREASARRRCMEFCPGWCQHSFVRRGGRLWSQITLL